LWAAGSALAMVDREIGTGIALLTAWNDVTSPTTAREDIDNPEITLAYDIWCREDREGHDSYSVSALKLN
jgi:hypothetical protein